MAVQYSQHLRKALLFFKSLTEDLATLHQFLSTLPKRSYTAYTNLFHVKFYKGCHVLALVIMMILIAVMLISKRNAAWRRCIGKSLIKIVFVLFL